MTKVDQKQPQPDSDPKASKTVKKGQVALLFTAFEPSVVNM